MAELDGRVVGLVHYIEHRTCWSEKNSFYLQDLFADEHVRGKVSSRVTTQLEQKCHNAVVTRRLDRVWVGH